MQISPPNGVKFKRFSRKTPLKWTEVKNAAYYAVEIQGCHPAGCEKDTRPFRNLSDLNGTEYQLDIPKPGYWRWRVWAVDRQGKVGPQSGWWEFRYPNR
jgi:hypothetical protein